MTKRIQYVNGIPTTVDSEVSYYDESILVTTEIGVSGTGYTSDHKTFTLPNAKTYDGTKDQLKVQVNGVGQVEGVHFTYGSGGSETTFTFINAVLKNALVRMTITQ